MEVNEARAAWAVRRGAALALIAVAAYYAIWGGEYSAFDLRRLDIQKTELTLMLAETERQVDSLKNYAERLEHDPATIEAVARERFGMIRDGEILYRFVPLPELDATPAREMGAMSAAADVPDVSDRTP
jgi:cell division protein FtsB